MSDVEQGGPAFPRPGFEQPAGMQEGMTLRDWFAGQALSGAIVGSYTGETIREDIAQQIAEESYALADAMLAARKTGAPS